MIRLFTTQQMEANPIRIVRFKLGLANFHFTEDTTIRYFAESSAGFRSDLSTATVDIVELEDLSSISLNVPSSDLYMAPLALDIAANGVQIIYTLDGSNPKECAKSGSAICQRSIRLKFGSKHFFDTFYFGLMELTPRLEAINMKLRLHQTLVSKYLTQI